VLLVEAPGHRLGTGGSHRDGARELGVLLETHSGVLEEASGRDVQRGGKVEDVVEPHVAPPSLQTADVGPMEAGQLSESLLREAPCQSQFADARSEGGTSGVVDAVTGPRHDRGTLGTV
jgi:hypothetical protein